MKIALSRESMVVGASVVAMLLPFLVLGGYVAQKHQWAQARLDELRPRYARLLGLETQRADMASTLARADAARAQYTYPATQDANQAGNAAQQRIRDIFSSAGLQIISSQVLPPKDDKNFDRIPIVVRTEGEMLAVQSALAVLSSQAPAIVINDLDVQLPGGLANALPKVAPRLAVTFSLNVLRERS